MLFKNPVRTSKKTLHFTITKINWVTLFKKIVTVYTQNHTKNINTECQLTAKEAKAVPLHAMKALGGEEL
jgi:hypothetical protein